MDTAPLIPGITRVAHLTPGVNTWVTVVELVDDHAYCVPHFAVEEVCDLADFASWITAGNTVEQLDLDTGRLEALLDSMVGVHVDDLLTIGEALPFAVAAARCACGHRTDEHTATPALDGRAGCRAAAGLARCGCELTTIA